MGKHDRIEGSQPALPLNLPELSGTRENQSAITLPVSYEPAMTELTLAQAPNKDHQLQDFETFALQWESYQPLARSNPHSKYQAIQRLANLLEHAPKDLHIGHAMELLKQYEAYQQAGASGEYIVNWAERFKNDETAHALMRDLKYAVNDLIRQCHERSNQLHLGRAWAEDRHCDTLKEFPQLAGFAARSHTRIATHQLVTGLHRLNTKGIGLHEKTPMNSDRYIDFRDTARKLIDLYRATGADRFLDHGDEFAEALEKFHHHPRPGRQLDHLIELAVRKSKAMNGQYGMLLSRAYADDLTSIRQHFGAQANPLTQESAVLHAVHYARFGQLAVKAREHLDLLPSYPGHV